jgi:hypothetical protein
LAVFYAAGKALRPFSGPTSGAGTLSDAGTAVWFFAPPGGWNNLWGKILLSGGPKAGHFFLSYIIGKKISGK